VFASFDVCKTENLQGASFYFMCLKSYSEKNMQRTSMNAQLEGKVCKKAGGWILLAAYFDMIEVCS
jgi:hypothetical protein